MMLIKSILYIFSLLFSTSLNTWVQEQRKLYKKNKLLTDRLQRLRLLNFTFELGRGGTFFWFCPAFEGLLVTNPMHVHPRIESKLLCIWLQEVQESETLASGQAGK